MLLLLLLLLLAERIVGRRDDVLAVRRVCGRAEHRLRREVRENVRCTDGAHANVKAAGTILPTPASYQAQ